MKNRCFYQQLSNSETSKLVLLTHYLICIESKLLMSHDYKMSILALLGNSVCSINSTQ
jgi:hypothetical protein